MLLLLAACTGSPDDSSGPPPGPPELPDFAACLVQGGASTTDASASILDQSLAGTITATGSGEPPTGCLDRERWIAGNQDALDTSLAVWLTLETDGGDSWELSVTSGVFPDPAVLLGESATIVSHSQLAEPFAGQPGETAVTLAAPGFQGWVGIAGGVDTLSPVEPLTLTAGDQEGTWSDDCLDYTLVSLAGTQDGTTRSAPTGETVGFGEVALYSAGVVIATNPRCSETMGGYAGAATWSFPL